MLDLKSIHKRLGSFTLNDLSLRLQPDEYFVLLGPSGVGKTVVLEIIAGLMQPDNGQILWQDKDITFTPPHKRAFPVVYQDYALFPHLTVAQNIAYGLKVTGIKPNETNKRVNDLAEMLGIQDLLDCYPGTLSGGEQQRVALARALAIQPRMLLLDEPLSALDSGTRVRLRKELKRIHKASKTTFLHITHDVEEAMALGQRIGVMLNGRIHQIAKPEELFRKPSDSEVADFLGLHNVLPITSIGEDVCRTAGVEIPVPKVDDSVSHLWIKPEEIILSRQPFASSARNQFRCTVLEWEHRDPLLAVTIGLDELRLCALITYTSFDDLNLKVGTEVYATFKTSAVHCF